MIQNTILVIKSRELRWARHVACMGRGVVHTGVWRGSVRERDHLEGQGLGGRILLNRSESNGMGEHGLD